MFSADDKAPEPCNMGRRSVLVMTDYFLLRRWWRVLRSNLRCFFFDMRLRRFLITEPMGYLTKSNVTPGNDAHKTQILPCQGCECEIMMTGT